MELSTQSEISAEIGEAQAATAVGRAHPDRGFAPYRSSALRHPKHGLVRAAPEEIELASPVYGHSDDAADESDLTIQHPERGRSEVPNRIEAYLSKPPVNRPCSRLQTPTRRGEISPRCGNAAHSEIALGSGPIAVQTMRGAKWSRQWG